MKKFKKYIILFLFSMAMSSEIYAQDTCRNFIRETLYLDSLGSDAVFNVHYYDDLGRPDQTVKGGLNPNEIYVHSRTQYNPQGHVTKSWCPIPDDETQRYLTSNDFQSLSTSLFSDNRPYQEIEYDAMGRPISTTMPGDAWSSKSKSISYRSNTTGEVKYYKAQISGSHLVQNGYYAAGRLLCETTVDEDGITVRQYTDMQGNVVLERRGETSYLDTYFVYNELGLLRFVLSPMYQEDEDLTLFAYEYKYDDRGRVTEKRIPGRDAIKYWYDRADRMVCVQDGELRARNLYRRFFFDKLGRPVAQCLANSYPSYSDSFYLSRVATTPNSNVYGTLTKQYGYGFIPKAGLNCTAICADMNNSLSSIEAVNYYDSYTFLDIFNIPASIQDSISSSVLITGNTNSPLPIICGKPSNMLAGTVHPNINGGDLIQCHQYDAKGRLIYVAYIGLDNRFHTDRMEYNFTGDIKSEIKTDYNLSSIGALQRIVTSIQNNYYYPHTKLPHYRTMTLIDGTGRTQHDTLSFEYDEWGNVASATRQGGTSADMEYAYDTMHGWLKNTRSTGGFEQTLYRQDNPGNRRYNGSISAMYWYIPSQGRCDRRYDYTYDEMGRLLEATYSEPIHLNPFDPDPGVVSPDSWSNEPSSNLPEPLSLIPSTGLELTLADAIQGQPQSMGADPLASGFPIQPIDFNKYGETIEYDKNCNITALQRRGLRDTRLFGLIDDLEISYNGNQRTYVMDASGSLSYDGSSDFVDVYNASPEYYYNHNGALIRDLNRGIHNISYNNLGNIASIAFYNGGPGNYIYYTYSADGSKLRSVHERRLSNTGYTIIRDTTDYIGNLILYNGHPESYQFDGGYFSFNNDTIDGIHYYIKDYLGSTRMVVDGRADTIEQVTHYYPYGGVIGDISTNHTVQKYKFEGKELDRAFGLDNYDIHARQYFSMAPTWDRIDPLAEICCDISPYMYCGGDPINYGDYNGMDWYTDNNGNYFWRDSFDPIIYYGDMIYYNIGPYFTYMDGYSIISFYQNEGTLFGEADGDGNYRPVGSETQGFVPDYSIDEFDLDWLKNIDYIYAAGGGLGSGWNRLAKKGFGNYMTSKISYDGNIYKQNGKPIKSQRPGKININPKANRPAVNIGKLSKISKYGNKIGNIGYITAFYSLYSAETNRERTQIIGGTVLGYAGGELGAFAGTCVCPGVGTYVGAVGLSAVGYHYGQSIGAWIYDLSQ